MASACVTGSKVQVIRLECASLELVTTIDLLCPQRFQTFFRVISGSVKELQNEVFSGSNGKHDGDLVHIKATTRHISIYLAYKLA